MLRLSKTAGLPYDTYNGEAFPNNDRAMFLKSAPAYYKEGQMKNNTDHDDRFSSAHTRSVGSIIPDPEFYAKKKEEKDPTVKWEAAFSRNGTSSSNRQIDKNLELATDDAKSTALKSSAGVRRVEFTVESDPEPDPEPVETLMPNFQSKDDSNINDYLNKKPVHENLNSSLQIEETRSPRVTAIPEEEAEQTFMSKVKEQKNRVDKIRKARAAATVIQRAWRRYHARTKYRR
ncbi:hypothetical protein KUTeg_022750 [Tegillarca granosa]|uniref:Uncharacterized protein n=1 Tax=Tegillarca granosa TaxID=220873 RepID=A0ABQ9E5G2_TEGGR|nr:hypothetical protein KUTeg_022750 [Tegillarca granosa]